MRSIQMAVTSAGICFRRRLNNSKTYLALAVMAIFSFYIFSPVCQLASYYQISCPPWLFPFFMSFPIMLMVHGGLCLLLFSDGGENDGYSYLMLARCGRKATMMGRLLEVLLTSFLYALILLVFSVVFILPVLGWDSDWGTLAAHPGGILRHYGGANGGFPLLCGFPGVHRPVYTIPGRGDFLPLPVAFHGVYRGAHHLLPGLLGEVRGNHCSGFFRGDCPVRPISGADHHWLLAAICFASELEQLHEPGLVSQRCHALARVRFLSLGDQHFGDERCRGCGI